MLTDAGYGWRVEISRVSSVGGFVLNVKWQRTWQRGVRLTDGPRGATQVTLQPGVPILFDYVSASDDSVAAGRGNLQGRFQTLRSMFSCSAIGMGLELRVPAIIPQAVLEVNLWLVRTLPDGAEQSQRQVLRARQGSQAEFFFDDLIVALTSPRGRGTPPAAGASTPVRTSGGITPLSSEKGKLKVELVISQYVVAASAKNGLSPGGSTTF